MFDSDWRPSHSLDGIWVAIPSLEPELIFLASRISAHVEEYAGQFIGQHQHALRPCLQENGETLDGHIRYVEPRRDEWPRIRRRWWHHWLRSNFAAICFHREDLCLRGAFKVFFPFISCCFCCLDADLMSSLQLSNLVAAVTLYLCAGREVFRIIPDRCGEDINDVAFPASP